MSSCHSICHAPQNAPAVPQSGSYRARQVLYFVKNEHLTSALRDMKKKNASTIYKAMHHER